MIPNFRHPRQRRLRVAAFGLLACVATGALLSCGPGSSGSASGGNSGSVPPPAAPAPSPPATAGGSVVFSTYVDALSTQWEMIRDVAVDGSGNIYVAGGSSSPGGIDLTAGNDYKTSQGASTLGAFPDTDIFVMKFSPTGTLLWSSRLGTKGYDRAYAIEVIGGKVVIAGRAGGGLQTTAGVFQPSFAGDTTSNQGYGQQDGFVARLDAQSGKMEWTTYLGGSDSGYIRDMDVASDGTVHIGYTNAAGGSGNLITSDAMVKTAATDIYVQLSADGKQLRYGTYLGNGNSGVQSVRLDPLGNLAVEFDMAGAGSPAPTAGALQPRNAGMNDVYVIKLAASTQQRTALATTYLGGSGDEGVETHQIAVDSQGRIYATAGHTSSSDIPVNSNGYQRTLRGPSNAFISLLSADGKSQLGATYFGGSSTDSVEGIFVTDKAVYISGTTHSPDLPVTDRTSLGGYGGGEDGYIAVFSLDLSQLLYATYVGGSGDDQARSIAVDANGGISFGGQTTSTNLALKNARDTKLDGEYGAFLVKLAPLP